MLNPDAVMPDPATVYGEDSLARIAKAEREGAEWQRWHSGWALWGKGKDSMGERPLHAVMWFMGGLSGVRLGGFEAPTIALGRDATDTSGTHSIALSRDAVAEIEESTRALWDTFPILRQASVLRPWWKRLLGLS